MMKRVLALVLIIMIALSGIAAIAEYSRIVKSKMLVYSDKALKHRIGTVKK